MSEKLIKGIREGIKEIREQKYPYRMQYHYGFHDAVELCSKMIEKQIRKDHRVLLKTPTYLDYPYKGLVKKKI